MRLARRPCLAVAALLPALAPALHAASVSGAGPDGTAPSTGWIESVDVIDVGHWQSGLDLASARRLGQRPADTSFATPTLLRVGVGKSIELRASVDTLSTEDADAGTGAGAAPPTSAFESSTDAMRRLHGFTDVSFGAKWRVRGGDAGWLPGVAWLANVETITGSPAFRGPDVRPSLRATAEWTLADDMTLGLMPGVFRDRDDNGHHYAAGVLALTLGKAWTPRLHTFVELAGERASQQQRSGAFVDVDTGLAFLATSSVQVAALVSHGFMNTTQDVRGGLSVSTHF